MWQTAEGGEGFTAVNKGAHALWLIVVILKMLPKPMVGTATKVFVGADALGVLVYH